MPPPLLTPLRIHCTTPPNPTGYIKRCHLRSCKHLEPESINKIKKLPPAFKKYTEGYFSNSE
jgi:hypothetical protein